MQIKPFSCSLDFLLTPVLLSALAACAATSTEAWRPDGVAYSADLALSDEVAALAGRQGSQDEAAAAQEFVDYVLSDGVIDAAEREILRELLALGPRGDLRYLYQSTPYADLVAPSPAARAILSIMDE